MTEPDTIKLLRECDAGIKMGTASIGEVLEKTTNEKLKKLLEICKEGHEKLKEEIQNILALTLARAAAIVYGQVLTNEEMISLVDSLFACAAPNYTPDGKVVLATIREEEIEKLFK